MPHDQEAQSAKGPQRRVRLDHRRGGYWIDGKLREEFADDPSLAEVSRLLIARWAARFTPERVSDVQRQLLRDPAAERPVSLAQRELQENQRELQSSYLAALYESLEEEHRRIVEEPSLHEGSETASYPLSVGDIARITEASERQVRKWADDGLLPSFREGNQRRFYSAALIRAFAIRGASGPEKAVLSAAAHGEAGHLFQLIAAILGRAAPRFPETEAKQLALLAQELAWSSHLMSDVTQKADVARIWETALCPK